MLQPHLPPATAREALHALFGEAHATHSVAHVQISSRAIVLRCSCMRQPRGGLIIDASRARQSRVTLTQLREALRNAPRIPSPDLRGEP